MGAPLDGRSGGEILVAKILWPHGIQGRVKAELRTKDWNVLLGMTEGTAVRADGTRVGPLRIERVALGIADAAKDSFAILAFASIRNRDAASALSNTSLICLPATSDAGWRALDGLEIADEAGTVMARVQYVPQLEPCLRMRDAQGHELADLPAAQLKTVDLRTRRVVLRKTASLSRGVRK